METMQYNKLVETLDIRIVRGSDLGFVVEMRLGEREFPAGALDPAVASALAVASPEEQGARLFAAFTADERVNLAWNLAAALAPQRRIRLRIDDDAPELQALPWEALRDASPTATAREPAADRDTPFSRLVPASELLAAVEERPLRVLSAVAAPDGLEAYQLPAIDRPGEEACLAEAMARAPRGLLEYSALAGRCSLVALEAALEGGYHVLHLVAHGVARRDGGMAMFLERDDGGVDRVDAARFAEMLERLGRTLRLVVLMVCSSATRNPGDPRDGLVPLVLAAGVPAVLAMQDLMPIDTGRAFTRALYGELWAGGELDRAANRARATLLTGRLRGSAVPVLYSALAGNRLFAPADARPFAPAEAKLVAPPLPVDGWQALGGPFNRCYAERGRDGCVELFAIDTATAQQYVRRQQRVGGGWGAWEGPGRGVVDGCAAVDERGLISVFVVGPRRKVFRNIRVGAGQWGARDELEGDSAQICAACGPGGSFTVLAVDRAGYMQSRVQQQAGGGWYEWEGEWEEDSEEHLQIGLARDGRGLLTVFDLRDDHSLWQSCQDGEGEYLDWQRIGAKLRRFHVVADAGGRLRISAIAEDGALRHCGQRSPGGPWSAWQRVDGEHREALAAPRQGGGLELLVLDGDGAARHASWQGEVLGPWSALGGPALVRLAAVEGGAGELHVFGLDNAGGLHHRVLS